MIRRKRLVDPAMSGLRTDGARVCLRAARICYDLADKAAGAERRKLLASAAAAMQAVRRADAQVAA